MYIHITQGET